MCTEDADFFTNFRNQQSFFFAMVELQDSSPEWKGLRKTQSINVRTIGIWREGRTERKGKVRYVSDECGFMDGLGGVDGMVLAYRDKVVELDSKSSPAEVSMGAVGAAAKLSMQTWTRTRSHSPLNRCMAIMSALFLARENNGLRRSERKGQRTTQQHAPACWS